MQWSRGRLLLLAGFITSYIAILAWYHCNYAAGSDPSGYMNSAKLILGGKFTSPPRVPAGLTADVLHPRYLVPLGFRLDDAGQNLLPSYPVGLPLHLAAAGLVVGLEPAATVMAIATALAFAGLLFLTGREFGLPPGWSLAVAALAAISPLTLFFSLQVMSDLLAAVWTLAFILGALRSSRHAGWAAGAGAALAIAVLVRPTSLLLVLPAIVALQPNVRTWLAFVLGGLPGALFLAGYNHALFGDVTVSGYGDLSSLFSLQHVLPTLRNYATWGLVVATPLVLAAAVLPWLRIERRKKFTLLAWAAVILLFYAAYEPTHETWWYLRFILPALPALAIAAALALHAFVARAPAIPAAPNPATPTPGRPRFALGLFLVAAAWLLAWDRSLGVTLIEVDYRTYPQVGRWVTQELPPDAIVAAHQVSGAVLYYSDRPFINPFSLNPEDGARLGAWLDREHRPFYAVLYPFEEARILKRLTGQWRVVTRIRQTTVWRRVGSSGQPAAALRQVAVDPRGRNLQVSLAVFSANDFQIRVVDNVAPGGKARFQSVAGAMEALGGLAGCNGGFFERNPFTPVGLMVSDGTRSGRFDPESWMKGLLVVRNKVASLEPTASFQDTPGITNLIQSGPWLVRAGQAEPDNSRTQVARRTFICHDGRGTWALGASEPCTLSELAGALKSAEITAVLDIQSALNLDGGPSTGLWLRQPGGNFSLPERWPVRNYVGIFPPSSP